MSDILNLNPVNTDQNRFGEFPDEVNIPLNTGRQKGRKTHSRTMIGGKQIGGPQNWAINLLAWIQNKLSSNKFEVPTTSLGTVPGPFADDTAAGAGGVAIGDIYYETTTGIVNVRLV